MVQTPAHLVRHRVSMLHLSGLGRGGFKGLHRGLEKNTGGTRQKADLAARIQMFYEVFMISVRWFPVLKHAKTGTTWIELKNLESCFLFGKWCFASYSNCHTWATHCGKTPGAFWSKFLVNLGECTVSNDRAFGSTGYKSTLSTRVSWHHEKPNHHGRSSTG